MWYRDFLAGLADAKGKHIAVTLMRRTYEVDKNLSMVSVEFLCKTVALYLRILYTYLKIEPNLYLPRFFYREITFILFDPPSHKRVLSLALSIDTFIYQAAPSSRSKYTKKNLGCK